MTDRNRQKYKDYLKGKRVCIVGPAPTIKHLEQKEKIDSYDVVIRLNKALPVPESLFSSSGTKTNVLYNCLNPETESGGALHIGYLQEEVDWLVCPYPNILPFSIDIKNFIRNNQDRVSFCHFEEEYYAKIISEINTRPNTGLLTILDVLSCEIDELYITGITFFKGGYVDEYRYHTEESVMERMRQHGNHVQPPQISLFKKVLANDPRIKIDRFLEEVILENQ